MIRAGEMMVIIRAQDFASRTIHRVSGELAGMQKAQRIQMREGRRHLPLLQREAALMKNLAAAQRQYAMSTAAAHGRMPRGGGPAGWVSAQGKAYLEAKAALDAFRTSNARALGALPAHLQAIRNNLPAIKDLERSIRQFDAERLHRFGNALSGIGRTMQLFGAIGTAAFGLMANSFANFSQSAATAGTQMRDMGAGMDQAVARSQQLQKAILEMSMVFPNSAQDMTDAAYEIFSSMNLMRNGITDVNAGLRLLAVANKAAVAGGVDLAEATNAMVVALNIFDPQLKNVKGTMDEVFNIVRFGRIRLDDLGHVFTQFASAAHAAGMTLTDVGAAFATLTLFNDPGKASAGLGRLIELLRTPDFREGLKNLLDINIVNPDTGKMKPLLNIMEEIIKVRPDLAASRKAAIDFFIELSKASGLTKKGVQGTVQARRAFETFATHMDTFRNTVQNVSKNYDEMNKAFESRMADPGVQWELFKNRMKALALVIGKEVLPVFIAIGGWIARFIRWIQNMNGSMGGSIFKFAAIASVGLLVAGVFTSLFGATIQLIATLRILGIVSEVTGKKMLAFGTIRSAAAFGAIGAAAGVSAYLIMTHYDQVRAYFHAWYDDVGAGFRHFWADRVSEAKGAAGLIIMAFGKLREATLGSGRTTQYGRNLAVQAGKELSERSDEFLDNYNKWLRIYKKQRGKPGMDWLKDFKRITGEFDGQALSKEYKDWSNAVSNSTYTAAQRAKDHAQAVKQATENMQETIKTATTNLINQYETLQQQNRDALGGLFQGPTMQGFLGNIFSNINDTLRQFGVQIPVPFAILKQDLEQSVTYFKRWRNDIAQLVKRGLPYEMISEIQSMGPQQGMSIAEGLLSAPKGALRNIVKTYKDGQKLTDKATQDDMKRKLAYWNKFGKDAAWKTIMGIISNPKNAKIAKMYENYVKTTYGAILKKTFQDDVAEYMINAQKMAAAAATQNPTAPNPFTGSLFATGGNKNTIANMSIEQLVNSYKAAAKKIQRILSMPHGEHNPITQRELDIIKAQRRRQAAIRAEYARDAALAPSVKSQFNRQMRAGKEQITVTYMGDRVTIKADGATVQSVTRALAKKHFMKTHKNWKKVKH